MKKLMIVALMLTFSAANAEEVSILEADLSYAQTTYTVTAAAEFYMDSATGEGFVNAKVVGRRSHPNSSRPHSVATLFSKSVKVEGLVLMGDQAIYHGTQGNVVCGTMGLGRVLKVPTLYLNGNCVLNAKIINSAGKKLLITLTTK